MRCVRMISQEDYATFNQYSQQLMNINNQKNQLKMLQENVKITILELEKSKEKEVYRNLGVVLIKRNKEEMIKELNSEIETINIKIKALEKQEELVNKHLIPLKAKLDEEVKKQENKK